MVIEAQLPLLEIDDLVIEFERAHDSLRVVDGVSLHLKTGETLGIVGESGCGKSILSLSVLGLLPTGARVTSGAIRLAGRPHRHGVSGADDGAESGPVRW
jgi:ABC-type glutathione transport system ATPase component